MAQRSLNYFSVHSLHGTLEGDDSFCVCTASVLNHVFSRHKSDSWRCVDVFRSGIEIENLILATSAAVLSSCGQEPLFVDMDTRERRRSTTVILTTILVWPKFDVGNYGPS